MRTAAPAPPASGTAGRALLVAAVVLTAFNLRTAVTALGPLLAEVRRDVGLTPVAAGLLTSLPVLSFAAVGALAAGAARRSGGERVLVAGLLLVALGSLLRGAAVGWAALLASSALAFAGAALGNVLLPALVKAHFPHAVGRVTALYTSVLALGAAVAAAGSVPLADLAARSGLLPGWRWALAAGALPAAAAAALWLVARRGPGDRPPVPRPAAAEPGLRGALAAFFGAQALQAYVVMGWFAQFLREAGAPAPTAGWLLALVMVLGVPVSLAVPWLAGRSRSHRGLVVLLTLASLAGWTGLLVAPLAGAGLWAVLLGLGSGGFPLALALFALRSSTPEQTAALSGFAQSAGYAAAALGPMLVGWLHGTGGRAAPFAVLAVALAVQLGAGLRAASARRPR